MYYFVKAQVYHVNKVVMGDGLMGMRSLLALEADFDFRSKIIDEYIFYDGSTTFVQPICGIRSTFEVIICNMQEVIGGIQRNMSRSSPFAWMHLKYKYIDILFIQFTHSIYQLQLFSKTRSRKFG